MKNFLPFLATAAALLISAPAGWAASGFTHAGAFAQAFADGQAAHLHQIAVNHATGAVYVTDVVNDEIAVYAPAGAGGTLLTTFGAGDLTDPYGIAIDQSTGNVYVSDADDVVRFTSDGLPTPTFTLDGTFADPAVVGPLAFDQANHQLVVADATTNRVRRYDTSGATVAGSAFDGSGPGAPGAFTGLQDLALDLTTGDVLVVDATGDPGSGASSHVERYSDAGTWKATIGPVAGAATVAVVPATGDIVVSGNQDAVNRDEKPTLRQFGPDGSDRGAIAVDDSASYATISSITVDDGATGRLFAATDVSRGFYVGQYGLVSVQAYDQYVTPTVSLGAIDGTADGTSATLHGTVNPNGDTTSYRFEWSSDDGATWAAADGDGDGDEAAGSGTSDVAVTETLTGLTPNTPYKLRLVAIKSGASTATPAAALTTATVKPVVTTGTASYLAADGLRVTGTVDPRNAATTFWVEYGTTAAYGARYPVTSGSDAGAGTTAKAVGLQLAGLAAGTTYHYRLVAQNAAGTTEGLDRTATTTSSTTGSDGRAEACANAPVRAQQRSQRLPECRAYELVSPSDKGFNDVAYANGYVQSSVNGGRVRFASGGALDMSEGAPGNSGYIASRSDAGWVTRGASPPLASSPISLSPRLRALSPDLSQAVVLSRSVLADGAEPVYGNMYLRDYDHDRYHVIAKGGPSANFGLFGSPTAVQFSADGGVAAFSMSSFISPLTTDAAVGAANAYAYSTRTGVLEMIGKLPDETTPSGGSQLAVGLGSNNEAAILRTAISRDGNRILFVSPTDGSAPQQLYVRTPSGTTLISKPNPGVSDPDGSQVATFLGASRDGRFVFFTSWEKLTADSSATVNPQRSDLYRYDAVTDRVIDLSASADAAHGSVTDVIGISDDGAYVYFKGTANPAPAPVYAWHDGTLRTIGEADGNRSVVPEAVTPDGRYVAFSTNQPVNGVPSNETSQYVRYDYEQDRLVCASCLPDGRASTASAFGGAPGQVGGSFPATDYTPTVMSDDGRLLFTTAHALVAQDTNGRNDVYEYVDGAAHLITSGRGTQDAYFEDLSPDGKDVFFVTRERLVAEDEDDNLDLYDARVGGGWLSDTSTHTVCEGDACQGRTHPPAQAGDAPDTERAPATDAGAPPVRASVAIARPSASALATAARTGVLTIRARVVEAGTLTATARATIARSTQIAKTTKAVKGSGTVRLGLRLSAAARQKLRQKGRLAVSVTVTHSAARTAAKASLTLKSIKKSTSARRTSRTANTAHGKGR